MGLGGGSNDVFLLTGPNGSAMNVASFVIEPGPDFGEADLLKTIYSENPAMEGGVLAAEYVNVRRMAFPLRIASLSAFGGAAGVAAWLRTLARPGATLDIQLDGVATAEAVRFDVNAGRYEIGAWNTQMWSQTDRMEGTLKLDVQPFGYWPTMILLASAASIGGPGIITLDKSGSIFGDVPGFAELFVAPTTATSFGPVGAQKTDSVYWSLGARPSFQAWWVAPSTLAVASRTTFPATLLGDQYAPGSQTIRYFVGSGISGNTFAQTGWQPVVHWVIPATLEPAYRGRFRAYAWTRLGPSQVFPVQVSLDTIGPTTLGFVAGVAQQSLASAAPIATLPPAVASNAAGGASPAFSLLDLGEVNIPPIASFSSDVQLRLWMTSPTSNPGLTATGLIDIAGLYLQPLDGAAGVLSRGVLFQASSGGSISGHLYLPVTGEAIITSATSVVGSIGPLAQAVYHRGLRPRVGASSIQLDLNLAGVRTDSPSYIPAIRSEPHFANVSVRYQPRFLFVKGL